MAKITFEIQSDDEDTAVKIIDSVNEFLREHFEGAAGVDWIVTTDFKVV